MLYNPSKADRKKAAPWLLKCIQAVEEARDDYAKLKNDLLRTVKYS